MSRHRHRDHEQVAGQRGGERGHARNDSRAAASWLIRLGLLLALVPMALAQTQFVGWTDAQFRAWHVAHALASATPNQPRWRADALRDTAFSGDGRRLWVSVGGAGR